MLVGCGVSYHGVNRKRRDSLLESLLGVNLLRLTATDPEPKVKDGEL